MTGVGLWSSVVVIGGVASVARFLVDREVGRRSSGSFPLGTLVVNLSGAFLLGLLSGLHVAADVALLAGTAAIGSYTTFSTWVFESQRLAEERRHRYALVNVVGSLLLGVLAAAVGRLVGTGL